MVWSMRMSKLFWSELCFGSARKLEPLRFTFGVGNSAESRAASGSIKALGKYICRIASLHQLQSARCNTIRIFREPCHNLGQPGVEDLALSTWDARCNRAPLVLSALPFISTAMTSLAGDTSRTMKNRHRFRRRRNQSQLRQSLANAKTLIIAEEKMSGS